MSEPMCVRDIAEEHPCHGCDEEIAGKCVASTAEQRIRSGCPFETEEAPHDRHAK